MGRVRQVAHPIGLDSDPNISFTSGRPKLMVAGGLAWVKLAAPAAIKNPGGDLLSQGPRAPVPSALAGSDQPLRTSPSSEGEPGARNDLGLRRTSPAS